MSEKVRKQVSTPVADKEVSDITGVNKGSYNLRLPGSPSMRDLFALLSEMKADNASKHDRLVTEVTSLASTLQDVQGKVDLSNSVITKLGEKLDSNSEEIAELNNRIKHLEADSKQNGLRISDLEEKLKSLELEKRKFNLLIHGYPENPTNSEHPRKIVADLFTYLNMSFGLETCDAIYRLGQVRENNGGNPRPILVRFNRLNCKGEIYSKLKTLKESTRWTKISLADDLTLKQQRERRDLQALAAYARKQGKAARVMNGALTIEGIRYTYVDLNNLPEGITLGNAKTLHLETGIAFSGHHSYMSNLYPCDIELRGRTYTSAEQAYQHICALEHKEDEIATRILTDKDPYNAKKSSKLIRKSPAWKGRRLTTLKEVVTAKFEQHPQLKAKLISTGDRMLFEATEDKEFGCGHRLHQSSQIGQNSPGKNLFGKLLAEIRAELS